MAGEVATQLCRCLRAIDAAKLLLEPRSTIELAYTKIISGVEATEILGRRADEVERECHSFDATSSLSRILMGATQQVARERRLTPIWKRDFTDQAITILARGCGSEEW